MLAEDGVPASESSDAATRRRLPVPAPVLAAAAAALVIAGLVAGSRGVVSSDEGAVRRQVVLWQQGTWVEAYPLADELPAERVRPLPRGVATDDGVAPYARHPLYPAVLLVADGVGGEPGVVAVGLLGTLGAGLAGAALVRRLRPGLEVPTFLLLSLGSPLLFDGLIFAAHSLAAAATGVAALAAVHLVERARPPARWAVVLAAATAAAVLLRTEALLLVAALVAAAAVGLWRDPRRRVGWAVVGGVAAAAGAASAVAERALVAVVLGHVVPAAPGGAGGGSLSGRLDAAVTTWVQPGYGSQPAADALLLAALLLALVAGVVAARRAHHPVVVAAAVLSAAAAVARVAVGPFALVPGLAVAFPVGAALLVGLRPAVPEPARRAWVALVGIAALVVGGVLLTQYSQGGGVEWGGRYFAIVLPLGVAAAVPWGVDAVHGAGARRRVLIVAVVASCAAMGVLAVGSVREGRSASAELADDVAAAAAQAGGVEVGDGGAIVVSAERLLPQLLWQDADRYQWVVPSRRDLDEVAALVDDLPVERLVLVSADLRRDLDPFPGWCELDRWTSTSVGVAAIARGPRAGPGPAGASTPSREANACS